MSVCKVDKSHKKGAEWEIKTRWRMPKNIPQSLMILAVGILILVTLHVP